MDMTDENGHAGTALHGALGYYGIGLYQKGTGELGLSPASPGDLAY
jgi:hypothetical protein